MTAEFRLPANNKKLRPADLAWLIEYAAQRGGKKFAVLIDGRPWDIGVQPAKEQSNG